MSHLGVSTSYAKDLLIQKSIESTVVLIGRHSTQLVFIIAFDNTFKEGFSFLTKVPFLKIVNHSYMVDIAAIT